MSCIPKDPCLKSVGLGRVDLQWGTVAGSCVIIMGNDSPLSRVGEPADKSMVDPLVLRCLCNRGKGDGEEGLW